MKIFGPLRLTRKLYSKSRLRIALIVLVLLSLSYKLIPKLLFKVPPIYIGWKDDDFHPIKEKEELSEKEIIILRWTASWREYHPAKILNSDKCSMLEAGTTQQSTSSVFNVPCRISFDRRYLDISDALVFHSFDLMWEELPDEPRNLNQLWVYLQQEPPMYTKANLQAYPNIFNWTMTYRRDSDVYHPYGHFAPISDSPTRNLTFTMSTNKFANIASNLLKTKTRLVAWIVSSCDSHSKREYLVKELQKYVQVDIFGWCGQDCPPNLGNCYAHLEPSHKFYLSFENSLCTDYITEKFFNAMEANMVPVIYGGSQAQDYLAIAPNHSFIDSRNFKSPRDLANYLTYLDQNDEEYLKYFEWKSKYKVISTEMGWCNLCQRIYEHLQLVPMKERKWYRDLWRWWNYMSYDTNVENDVVSDPSQMTRIGQSYYYKLGAPACLPPLKKLINEGATKPNFEPGVLNGRIFGKLFGWAKDVLF